MKLNDTLQRLTRKRGEVVNALRSMMTLGVREKDANGREYPGGQRVEVGSPWCASTRLRSGPGCVQQSGWSPDGNNGARVGNVCLPSHLSLSSVQTKNVSGERSWYASRPGALVRLSCAYKDCRRLYFDDPDHWRSSAAYPDLLDSDGWFVGASGLVGEPGRHGDRHGIDRNLTQRPVFHLWEDGRTVILVNAQQRKAIPGRKTDMQESEWLADGLRHGRRKASFMPAAPIRELRDLTRYRKSLVQERAREVKRVQKVWETAPSKLSWVATEVLGKSGRDMLSAWIDLTTDAESLAELARGKLRKQLPQGQQALDSRVQAQHRLLLNHLLAPSTFLEETLEQLPQEIEPHLCPCEETMALLLSIPGIAALEARGYTVTLLPKEVA